MINSILYAGLATLLGNGLPIIIFGGIATGGLSLLLGSVGAFVSSAIYIAFSKDRRMDVMNQVYKYIWDCMNQVKSSIKSRMRNDKNEVIKPIQNQLQIEKGNFNLLDEKEIIRLGNEIKTILEIFKILY